MTCALAWFQPTTEHYGVVADRRATAGWYAPPVLSNKTVWIGDADRPPLLLAMGGDAARTQHVKALIAAEHADRHFATPPQVRSFLLELHAAACAGPRSTEYPPESGRSGINIAAAHNTGLYGMIGYSFINHVPAAQCVQHRRVLDVGAATEFIDGLMWGGLFNNEPMSPASAQRIVTLAAEYLPQSIGHETNSLVWPGPKPPLAP